MVIFLSITNILKVKCLILSKQKPIFKNWALSEKTNGGVPFVYFAEMDKIKDNIKISYNLLSSSLSANNKAKFKPKFSPKFYIYIVVVSFNKEL